MKAKVLQAVRTRQELRRSKRRKRVRQRRSRKKRKGMRQVNRSNSKGYVMMSLPVGAVPVPPVYYDDEQWYPF